VRRRREAQALSRNEGRRRQALDVPVQDRVHKSTKVWALYLDLEESLGTVDTARAAYDKCLALKVATPQMVLNAAAFLEEHGYFEDAFRVYEKGLGTFKFPHVKALWTTYLKKFVERYQGTKMERTRDLFEQCLKDVPAKDAAAFYLDYAKLEEEHGLSRHAMAVYNRACEAVPPEEQKDMYLLYAKKAEQYYGAPASRPVLQKAVEKLDDAGAKAMCLQFADLEKKLGEVDRARALFTHGSQFADPRKDPGYWKQWHEFEVSFGNEETFREMLRVKRSVQTAFAQVNYMAAEMASGEAPVPSDAEAAAKQAERDRLAGRGPGVMAPGGGAMQFVEAAAGKRKAAAANLDDLERQAARIKAATGGGGGGEGGAEAGGDGQGEAAGAAANPEEIDLDLDDDDEGGNEGDGVVDEDGQVRIEQKSIPSAVFGSAADQLGNVEDNIKKDGGDSAEQQPLGALARLRNK